MRTMPSVVAASEQPSDNRAPSLSSPEPSPHMGSNGMFDQMVAAMPGEAVVRIDRNGVITDLSSSFEELGLAAPQLLHRHVDVFVHPDDRHLLWANAEERRTNGGISHWAPLRLITPSGWRRVEYIGATSEAASCVAHIRPMTFGANATEQTALDEFVLHLTPEDGTPAETQLSAALRTLCDLTGWHETALRLESTSSDDLAVAAIDLDREAAKPWANADPRFVEVAVAGGATTKPTGAQAAPGAWKSQFSIPIGSVDSGVRLDLSHGDHGVVLTSRQRLLIQSAAEALAQSSTRWHNDPAPSPVLPQIDPVTRLASRLALVGDLSRRLRYGQPSSVAVFRIALSGLDDLREARDDAAAAHIVVAVSHAIRFVLDDAMIARTADDELTVVTSELEEGETPADVAAALLVEMEESFSWRFGVVPVIVAQAAASGASAAELLAHTQLDLAAKRSQHD